MFDLKNLKPVIIVTKDSVECPVKNCTKIVARQRESFKTSDEFMCPNHRIYISSSTFEYENEQDNILWKDNADLDLFNRIRKVKRESRMARDNSEDAVTWNVFRFLERKGLLPEFLANLIKQPVENPEVIYWSYSRSEQSTWEPLQKARETFEINPKKGSEPDIVIRSNSDLFFIETKLTASNNTVPASKNTMVKKKYETGGNGWYSQVLKSDFKTVAVTERKYELLRFWLLGSWIAQQLNLDYYLVNLTPSEKEKTIEKDFKQHVRENSKRIFLRTTWEDIYHFVLKNSPESIEKPQMIEYFRNKTSGYRNCKLQKAFSISH
jgi:hypothetical protein